jgi:hypothetical protein
VVASGSASNISDSAATGNSAAATMDTEWLGRDRTSYGHYGLVSPYSHDNLRSATSREVLELGGEDVAVSDIKGIHLNQPGRG